MVGDGGCGLGDGWMCRSRLRVRLYSMSRAGCEDEGGGLKFWFGVVASLSTTAIALSTTLNCKWRMRDV